MESKVAIQTLDALAQGTRLEAFRLLVNNAPDGLPAGQLAQRLKVPPNTLSAHLGVLSRAGLVATARRGRQVLYCANLGRLKSLLLFLLNDCCAGSPDFCEPPAFPPVTIPNNERRP